MHNRHNYDLGNSTGGKSRADIDQSFSLSNTSVSYQCAVCGQPPNVRLIARKEHLNTEDLRKRGFMCNTCVQGMSREDYDIQPM